MKNRNFLKNSGFLMISLLIITIGCKKELNVTNQSQVNKDPVAAIRSIVGNKGTISFLKSQQNSSLKYSEKEEVLKDSILRILSIQEFKKVYQELNSLEYIQIGLDSNLNQKKSSSEYADDDYVDDPGKPGLHKVQFYAVPLSYFNGTYGINDNISPFAILNLWYETDIYGRVIGTPLLFYTGASLIQTWTQLLTTSIQFNQSNLTSNFSIGGSTLIGISVFGQSLGWTTASKYIISINMNEDFGNDGKVIIQHEQK
jgi:hypothetical protein